jgi:hypothetical protein
MMRSVVFAANGLGGIIVKRANKSFASLLCISLMIRLDSVRKSSIDQTPHIWNHFHGHFSSKAATTHSWENRGTDRYSCKSYSVVICAT